PVAYAPRALPNYLTRLTAIARPGYAFSSKRLRRCLLQSLPHAEVISLTSHFSRWHPPTFFPIPESFRTEARSPWLTHRDALRARAQFEIDRVVPSTSVVRRSALSLFAIRLSAQIGRAHV